MLRSLGLGALSAAAFIVAEFATAGAATFALVAVGIGASATQAGLSINDYVTKSKAAEAGTGEPGSDIMSKGTADSALVSAVLDSIFVFLDGVGAAVGPLAKAARTSAKLLEAAEKGAQAAATAGLREAVTAGGPAAVQAIERSVAEAGIGETMRVSGKTADELAALVGKDRDLGKRILAAGDLASKGKALEKLGADTGCQRKVTRLRIRARIQNRTGSRGSSSPAPSSRFASIWTPAARSSTFLGTASPYWLPAGLCATCYWRKAMKFISRSSRAATIT